MASPLLTALLSLALVQGARAPVPSSSEQKKAERLIQKAFKADYASRSVERKKALAQTLLKEGDAAEGDPIGRYVFYREARDAAVEAGEPLLAAGAVDRLYQRFDIDLVEMKTDALSKCRSRALRVPGGPLALTRAYRNLLDQILALDAFEDSDRTGRAAEAAAAAARDPDMLEEIRTLRKELAAVKREHRTAKSALESLKRTSDDPDLNLKAGLYICLAKGQWTRGLPMLAKGSDAALKELATKDLAAPEEGLARRAVGDGWWELAENERDDLRKSRLNDRVRYWYEAALPDLTTLARLQVEARLKEMEESPFRPRGRQGGSVDLLKWIDPKQSQPPVPEWSFEGRVLETPATTSNVRLMSSCIPPEEYDVIATVERKSGTGHFTLGLVAEEKKFHVIVDYQNARMTTMSYFNQLWGQGLQRSLPDEKILHSGPIFTNGKPSRIICSVRAGRLSVSIDGKALLSYQDPSYETATVYPGFAVQDESTISLAVSGPFRVHGLVLRPVKGLPKRLR